MMRRFLIDECSRVEIEERAGIRIRSVDFFERFKAWGHVSTHMYTIARFGIELREFLRGLTERDAFQSTLTKGRSNEGVYYFVRWAQLQAHLQTHTHDKVEVSTLLGKSESVGGVARGQCRRRHSLMRIRSFVASGLKRLGCVKDRTTLKYLGVTSFDTVIKHIETKMHNYNTQHPEDTQMTFENMQLDHIRPVQRFALDMNHYTNLQPMLADANLSKSAKWSSTDEMFWKANIHHNAAFTEIYQTYTPPSTLDSRASLKERDPVAFALKKQEYRMKLARHMGITPDAETVS